MPPLICRLGGEDPQRRARDEMALKIESVLNGGVHAEKLLGGASRLEPLHFVLSSSHRLMRVFDAIVLPQPPLVPAGPDGPLCSRRETGGPFVTARSPSRPNVDRNF
jgi:hypothetical protein